MLVSLGCSCSIISSDSTGIVNQHYMLMVLSTFNRVRMFVLDCRGQTGCTVQQLSCCCLQRHALGRTANRQPQVIHCRCADAQVGAREPVKVAARPDLITQRGIVQLKGQRHAAGKPVLLQSA